MKMYLNKIGSKVHIDEYLPDALPVHNALKQGEVSLFI
jgi:hypothetical protein